MAAALVLLVGSSSACTSDSGPADAGSAGQEVSPEVTVQATVPAVPVEVSRGSITGQVTKQNRKVTVDDVADVADQWLEAAYVGGDYPRTGFGTSFPGFSKAAAKLARADKDLMTNADLGDRIDAVAVKHRRVVVDLLGVDGSPRAATARVDLKFATTGLERKVRVRGRLFLTKATSKAGEAEKAAQGWQVFGYDVTKARS